MRFSPRQQQILDVLIEKESATVSEFSDLLQVSAVTVRSDLNYLAEHGDVVRTHGGAHIAHGRTRQELSYAVRQEHNAVQKAQIGQLAASLISPVESILLDASSTAVSVARSIKGSRRVYDLTVVTTGIWIALELMGVPHVNVVLAGGFARERTGSLTGPISVRVLQDFNFSKAFLGAWGVTPVDGLTDLHLSEVELKRTIVQRTQTVIAILDGSKFGRLGLASFASPQQIDRLITDESAPKEMVEALRQQGVDVLIAAGNQPS